MRSARRLLTPALALLVLAIPGGVGAGRADDPITPLADVAEHAWKNLGKARNLLSSGGQQFMLMHSRQAALARASRFDYADPGQQKAATLQAVGPYANDVMAPSDFISRLAGMTQSETSAAWCGTNAIIGFNDSGSFSETLFKGARSTLSFNGWTRSTDGGQTFTDQGPLVAQPKPPGFSAFHLFGDPVTGCPEPSTFYYSSLAEGRTPARDVVSGISVSKSTDGGDTFDEHVLAAGKDGFEHFLDKEWMAVDGGPTASPEDDVIHVTYTDFDFSFTSPACPDDVRTAIEHVRSVDGGETWSPPQVIDERCGGRFVQGSQVEADGNTVYVAWERYGADFVTREIRIRKSTDGGATFGNPLKVTDVTPVGDSFELQGLFRDFLDLQGLAVDRSGGPSDGDVYLTFQDGSRVTQRDPVDASFTGGCLGDFQDPRYCFGDVYVTRSSIGRVWSPPVMINQPDGQTDQFMPAVEVGSDGTVWAHYYDRSTDARNFLIRAVLATSTDGGDTWTETFLTEGTGFAPVTGWQDFFVNPFYMGDYQTVAVDQTGGLSGPLISWGDNALGDANVAYEAP
jgi:hypothetical protein